MGNFYKRKDIIDNKYYGIPDYIDKDFSDIPGREIRLREGDRLDILAEQLYENPSYWKYIALYNDIGYMFDAQPGDIIRIPIDIQQVIDRV